MPKQEELAKQALRRLLLKENEYVKEINDALVRALKDIRVILSRIYEKYAVEGKLDKVTMAKYSRYASMEKEILDALTPELRNNVKTIKYLLPEQYNYSFFNHAWLIDNVTGLRLSWGIVNKIHLVSALSHEFEKIALERYPVNAKFLIRQALNDGLLQGKSYDKMMKDVRKALDITKTNAMRIVRTEGQAIINAGQDAAYLKALDLGVKGKIRWDATLDLRTRPANKWAKGNHREMDGQYKDKDGLFHLHFTNETAPYPGWSGLSAGQRISCRCIEVFVIEGYEPTLMRTRSEGIIPYQPYNEWYEQYGKHIKGV